MLILCDLWFRCCVWTSGFYFDLKFFCFWILACRDCLLVLFAYGFGCFGLGVDFWFDLIYVLFLGLVWVCVECVVGLDLLFVTNDAVSSSGFDWCNSLSYGLLIWLSGWKCSFVSFLVALLYFEFGYCLCFVRFGLHHLIALECLGWFHSSLLLYSVAVGFYVLVCDDFVVVMCLVGCVLLVDLRVVLLC